MDWMGQANPPGENANSMRAGNILGVVWEWAPSGLGVFFCVFFLVIEAFSWF